MIRYLLIIIILFISCDSKQQVKRQPSNYQLERYNVWVKLYNRPDITYDEFQIAYRCNMLRNYECH